MGKQRLYNSILKNNKGASLVLVLVAMFFVGVIASIVLTITVGNAKSTRTSQDSSQNFYSTESALDDLKLYLSKLATSAAADAYASVLTEDGVVADDKFNAKFFEKLNERLTNLLGDSDIAESRVFKNDFLNQYVTYGRLGDISISFGDIETVTEVVGEKTYKYPKLTNVQVSLTGNADTLTTAGYENTITTDIVFRAQNPGTGTPPTNDDSFAYDISRYVLISGKDILPDNFCMVDNTFVGGIYAFGYMNLANKDATEDASVDIQSQEVVIGRDINIRKGTLNFSPLTGSENVFNTILASGETLDTDVWCDNLKIGDADVTWSMSGRINDNLYLRKNLVLNGNGGKNSDDTFKKGSFTGVGGNIVGYSNREYTNLDTSVSNIAIYNTDKEPLSSAIIINGLGARLDLSGVNSLTLAGQAYTAMSSLENLQGTYSEVPTLDTNPNDTLPVLSYFTQGESITYRPAQALYLIPGDSIPAVGHNPMTEYEFKNLFEKDGEGTGVVNTTGKYYDYNGEEVVYDVSAYVNSPKYKRMYVRYVKGSNDASVQMNVYLFWNFTDTDAAVNYLTSIAGPITNSESRYEGLLKKQAEMLTRNNGFIKLPTTTVEGKTVIKGSIIGNGIDTDNASKYYKGTTSASMSGLTALNELTTTRNKLVSTLNQHDGDGETSLVHNMFTSATRTDGLNGVMSKFTYPTGKTQDVKDLTGPLDDHTIGKVNARKLFGEEEYNALKEGGKDIKGAIAEYDETSSWKYKLIYGTNVTVNENEANTKYVVISSGDVHFDISGDFYGIVIAGGNIYIPRDLTLECMGIIPEQSATIKFFNGSETDVVDTRNVNKTNIGEFNALLETVVNDADATNGNTILRKIFNIAYNGTESTDPEGTNFVSLDYVGWSRE